MSSKNKIRCVNCGREISGINAAKNDGWIIREDGTIFCCCVCIGEYSKKEKAGARKKRTPKP